MGATDIIGVIKGQPRALIAGIRLWTPACRLACRTRLLCHAVASGLALAAAMPRRCVACRSCTTAVLPDRIPPGLVMRMPRRQQGCETWAGLHCRARSGHGPADSKAARGGAAPAALHGCCGAAARPAGRRRACPEFPVPHTPPMCRHLPFEPVVRPSLMPGCWLAILSTLKSLQGLRRMRLAPRPARAALPNLHRHAAARLVGCRPAQGVPGPPGRAAAPSSGHPCRGRPVGG